jgi:predicted ATPase/class 3 adenylate cyclase
MHDLHCQERGRSPMGDFDEWLERLGLSRHRAVFAEHDIDREILPDLTDQDLEKLGLSLGHRKKLLRAIAELGRPESGPQREPEPAPRAAERRQLTVLFCDLVGSTELAGQLDPEDLRDVMGAYQAACAQVIDYFDGHVAKYLGDGVLAYFGWPFTHEDDAERAVRAGLALVAAVGRLGEPEAQPNAPPASAAERRVTLRSTRPALADPGAGMPLEARVGIATGIAVVGDLVGEGAAREEAVVGETPNLAARLQALAAPGSVVISQATRRLVGGLFELDDLGPQRLKGFAEPLAAWRVAGEGRAEGRFEARQTAGLTPLVGRDEELALLLRRWRRASDGEGQVVLLSGEPGIGKSRLVRELRARLADEPHVRLLYQCSPHHMTSPLHPQIEQLERAAGFARDDRAEEKLDKLETLLARGTAKLDAAVPLVAALLGMPTAERYPLPEMTPQRQKQLTLEALVDQVEGLAGEQPVLLAYEDVHWIDPTTQELLGLAIERIRSLPALLLITFRPEFTPPWSGQPHVSALALSRLGRREGAALVERVVREKALPDEVAAQIVAKSDGVPLFVEELTKTVLESGLLKDAGDHYELAGPLPPLAIPATLHDSLLARLDRLAPVKGIAQIGAALGRDFPHALLAAVAAERSDAELEAGLDQLVAAELVYRRGAPPDATYSFKHALVQDAAYGTLLKSRRQQLHARIVEVLEERFNDTAPEVLARHCTEAGLNEKAAMYWYEAGQWAIRRSAYTETLAHLNAGLKVLDGTNVSTQRARQALRLRLTRAEALQATRGYIAPETIVAYNDALDLARAVGDFADIFPALRGTYIAYSQHGDNRSSLQVGEECLQLALRQDDSAPQSLAHRIMGQSSMFLGDLEAAREHLEQAYALYDSKEHYPSAATYGLDLKSATLNFLSPTLWLLGYPDQALAMSDSNLSHAHQLGYAFNLALAMMWIYYTRMLRREYRAGEEQAEQLLELASKHGISDCIVAAKAQCALAKSLLGASSDQTLVEVRQCMGDYRDKWDKFVVPYNLGTLASAVAAAGRSDAALSVIAEALALNTDECWSQAELQRLTGEILLAEGGAGAGSDAEACFERSLEIARRQSARSWELRTVTSLAGLWHDQGKRQKANDLLAPVYGWFTEGFETQDLKDAKALLDELA